MSIILKILLGILVLLGLFVVALLLLYVGAVVYHERQWRKKIDDNYDEREKEHQAQE